MQDQKYEDAATVLAAQQTASRQQAAAIKPGSANWGVIIVGSGAAGGMAAFQLASAGVKVLLLEAGRMINPTWTILALCWRAMDYLQDEMKKSNV